MLTDDPNEIRRKTDLIFDAFMRGDADYVRINRCPECGGRFLFSISKGHLRLHGLHPGRYECSGFFGCIGCGNGGLRFDGTCPEWAEGITDWEKFVDDVYGE